MNYLHSALGMQYILRIIAFHLSSGACKTCCQKRRHPATKRRTFVITDSASALPRPPQTRPTCRDGRERPFGWARMKGICHKSEIRESGMYYGEGVDGCFGVLPDGLSAARGGMAQAGRLATPSLRAQRSNPESFPQRQPGLLRCSRNDEEEAASLHRQ